MVPSSIPPFQTRNQRSATRTRRRQPSLRGARSPSPPRPRWKVHEGTRLHVAPFGGADWVAHSPVGSAGACSTLHHSQVLVSFAAPSVGARCVWFPVPSCFHGTTKRASCEDHAIATSELETVQTTTFTICVQEHDYLRLCKTRTSSALSHHGQCSGAQTHRIDLYCGWKRCAQPGTVLLLQRGRARSTACGGGTLHA